MDEWKREDEELMELEQRLREGLQRVPAPLGLEARVMAAAASRGRRKGWMGVRADWAVAAAMLSLVGAGAVAQYERVEQQRRAAAVAHEQVVEALRITAAKLDLVRNELKDKGDER